MGFDSAFGWDPANPIENWGGVTVSEGRVTSLALIRIDLPGPFPGELMRSLTGLKKLHLIGAPGDPGLSGEIPAWLGDAIGLQDLMLTGHQLSGPIPPELGNLPNLVRLDLRGNQLSGPIPPELGNLPNLQDLDLSYNQLSGPIPPELGNLPNLERLELGGNQLSGLIPRELGNLSNLVRLDLRGNQLVDLVPHRIADLPNLQRVDSGGNQPAESLCASPEIMDQLPEALARDCGDLQAFYLVSGERLAQSPCTSPAVVDQSLEALVADCEALWLFYATQARKGRLEHDPANRWSDPATAWSGNNPLESWRGVTVEDGRVTRLELEWSDIGSARLSSQLGNLTGLKVLAFVRVHLYGTIPDSIKNLTELEMLFLLAPIPGDITPLYDLQGRIPEWIGDLTNLEVLVLNGLSGPIPAGLGNLFELRRLDLSYGNVLGPISGPIPPELGNLTNVIHMSLEHNRLSGPIPPEFGKLADLQTLDMSDNQLSGPMPPELANLRSLSLNPPTGLWDRRFGAGVAAGLVRVCGPARFGACRTGVRGWCGWWRVGCGCAAPGAQRRVR